MTTVAPRPSGSICLVRDGDHGIDVLMAQRTHTARFMPGAWVFPGGVVDELDWSDDARNALSGIADGDEDWGWLAAAVRETVEETGIWLTTEPFAVSPQDRGHGAEIFAQALDPGWRFDVSKLVYFSNWITPADLPIRFDARFFVMPMPMGIDGIPDAHEMSEVAWIRPTEAVAAAHAGSFELPFPTLKTIEWIASFADCAELMTWAESLQTVPETQPRLLIQDDEVQIVLPWDPGYDDLAGVSADVELLRTVVKARGIDGSPAPEFGPAT